MKFQNTHNALLGSLRYWYWHIVTESQPKGHGIAETMSRIPGFERLDGGFRRQCSIQESLPEALGFARWS